jgi:uncharacterized flavoprotein (TIGR03862 family)
VEIRTRHRWTGFVEGGYRFETPEGDMVIRPDATLLALGGASWPKLGSDAQWVPWLRQAGIAVADFRPANCGFDVVWSELFCSRFAGEPVKSVTVTSKAGTTQGEFVVSRHGVEGSLIYAHASALRDDLERDGKATLLLDLAPAKSQARLASDLARQPQKASFSTRLRKAVSLDGVKAALLRELVPEIGSMDVPALAAHIKALPVPLVRPRPIAEAISSAGGVFWQEIGEDYMLTKYPGLFVAGEMLDWEAPTGGYLLTACFATGRAAGLSILQWFLNNQRGFI